MRQSEDFPFSATSFNRAASLGGLAFALLLLVLALVGPRPADAASAEDEVWIIQFGAFESEEKARQLADYLRGREFTEISIKQTRDLAPIRDKLPASQSYYHVVFGPVKQWRAKDVLSAIKDSGVLEGSKFFNTANQPWTRQGFYPEN